MNLLYLAQEAKDAVEIQRYLKVADQELQRVSLITAQSLRFYKQSTRPQAVHAAELLDSVISMYVGQLDNSNVDVRRRYRTGHPIVCLESEIRQVLNNLVRNALDAMKGSGGNLVLRSREATDWRHGTRGIAITVADTGSGISAEAMKSIYTAFFTTKGIGGTGLGLWISSEIVGRHKGRFFVRSRTNSSLSNRHARGNPSHTRSGTVFILFLPFETHIT